MVEEDCVILQQTSSMATPMGLAAAAVVDDVVVVDVVVAVFCCAGETVADAVIGDGVNSMTAVEGAAGSEHAKSYHCIHHYHICM